jgi:hypothetical protein
MSLVQCSRQLLDWANWRQAVVVRLRLGRPLLPAPVPGPVVIAVSLSLWRGPPHMYKQSSYALCIGRKGCFDRI